MGHTGHVYLCSGWLEHGKTKARAFEDDRGRRRSSYACGKTNTKRYRDVGEIELTRWIHRVCPVGYEAEHMRKHGWVREEIPGKVWRSGNPAYRIVKASDLVAV
jgi:hypothetical protein